MKSFRFFSNWDAAKIVAQQRGGLIKRSHRDSTWIFFPKSGHPFDALNDAERKFVRRSTTVNNRLATFTDIQTKEWSQFNNVVLEIIQGKILVDSTGKQILPPQTPSKHYDELIEHYDELINYLDDEYVQIEREIAEGREDFHRSSEEGWYYSDDK